MHLSGKTPILWALSVLAAVQIKADKYSGQSWGNSVTVVGQHHVLKITRDMEVPAPWWRSPWLPDNAAVVPYYRDRFMLDWFFYNFKHVTTPLSF
ncbi:hypothetical protein P389DRAFT_172677 [Cystobasidium minutum MCA 4210]|uniref:uncharacterized protein n=1 Tax=Cystobasidium minutum MCA 4210 TaxID=1397322 RepID=UPI0034D00923|eukprot:jgi/Rhomi1/172677/fgenesh1_kg.5_\